MSIKYLNKQVKPVKKINYTVPKIRSRKTLSVKLKVYDYSGNEITTLVNENKPAGIYKVELDMTGFKSGLYFYQLFAGSFVSVRNTILLK